MCCTLTELHSFVRVHGHEMGGALEILVILSRISSRVEERKRKGSGDEYDRQPFI